MEIERTERVESIEGAGDSGTARVPLTRRGFLGGFVAAAGLAGACGALAGGALASEPGTSSAQGGGSPAGSGAQAGAGSDEAANAVTTAPADLNAQDSSYADDSGDYSAIFSPITIGNMTLRNRIVKPAAGSDTQPLMGATDISQSTLDYYAAIAKGGAALLISETYTVVAFGFDPGADLDADDAFDPDEGIAIARKLTDAVHQYGAYIGYQFQAPGGMGADGVSGVVNGYTVDQIKQYEANLGECARRLKEAGFDCVEIKGATTDTINGFMSRRVNQRTDEYGPQSLENRTRFLVECVQAVKGTCGQDFPVTVLMNALEENDQELGSDDGFTTLEEGEAMAVILQDAGVDFLQLRVGTSGLEVSCWAPDINHSVYRADGATGYGTQFDYGAHFAGLQDGAHSGAGAFIPLVAAYKQVLDIPVGCAGYVDPRTAPDMCNAAIADGKTDLLFVNRPLGVDPELPNKFQQGRRDEIAPCCRCLTCHSALGGGVNACRVNATSYGVAYSDQMPEGYEPTPAATPRKIAVVGGGPAGMEAARIAAMRGHEVTLYERQSRLGGLVNTARAYKGDHERLADLVDYLSRQLELTGVEVVTGTEVDAEFLTRQAPDAVIVAVGGSRESRVQPGGDDAPTVMGIDDFGTVEMGQRVVVLGAGVQAIDFASFILAQGKRVQIVNEADEASIDVEQSPDFRQVVKAHLRAHGVRIWNGTTADAVSEQGVHVTTGTGMQTCIPCDTVVECYDMVPNTALADELTAAGMEVHAVGDCAEPYNIQRAILAGNLAGRAV